MDKNIINTKIKDQTDLIDKVDLGQEVENYLYRTLLLEKIKQRKESEYELELEKLKESQESLSILEKIKSKKEYQQKLKELNEKKYELEIKTYREYENFLKDLYSGANINDSELARKILSNEPIKFGENIFHGRQYESDFQELLSKEFAKDKKDLDTEISSLMSGQNLSKRQSINHLLEITTKTPSLSKKLDEIYSEDNLKAMKKSITQNTLKALKISGAIMNPASFILREVISRTNELPVIKKMTTRINQRFDEALDLMGFSDKTKKYIKNATAITIGLGSALLIGNILGPEYLNANELFGGLDSSSPQPSETIKDTTQSVKSNISELSNNNNDNIKNIDMVKQAVSNPSELPKTEFYKGLQEHLNIKPTPESVSFTHENLIVKSPELKLPEVYDDIKDPANLVIDPERAAALHQTRLTGEVADILTQGASTEISPESKVATTDDILADLNQDTKTSIEPVLESTQMEKYVIQKGDTLSGIVEKLDSKDFDLQGQKLYAVVQLIAEQNNITNPHQILAGATIEIPKDTASLQSFCEANKDKLSEIMGREFIQSAQPMVSQNVPNIELPSHTAPVSASPNGFTQLAPEIEMPIQSEVIVPKEMLVQNSRLIASNILENIPKDQLESLMSNARTDEKQLLDILSANVEKQIMQDPAGQFEANKIVVEFNQDREALERQYGRTISDSMIRRMSETLVIEPSVIMNAYSSVETELKSTIAPSVTSVTNPTIELPKETVLSSGMETPQGRLEITTEKINGKEVVVHRTVRP